VGAGVFRVGPKRSADESCHGVAFREVC
jgi:hypothetical protein